MNRRFGPIIQNGYVVKDLERALDIWVNGHGVGPFFKFESTGVFDTKYRGNLTPLDMRVAIAYSGDIQIELIEPKGEDPSTYREFLDQGHEGLHHVAYGVEAIEALLAGLDSENYQIVQEGKMPVGGGFAYLDFGGTWGEIVELIELVPDLQAFNTMMKSAALDWDGSDPVRVVG